MTTAYDETKDAYLGFAAGNASPGNKSVAVTPSDTVDFSPYPKRVVVTVAGNLAVIPLKSADTPITFTAVPVGFVVPFRVRRVNSTGTTASAATIDD